MEFVFFFIESGFFSVCLKYLCVSTHKKYDIKMLLFFFYLLLVLYISHLWRNFFFYRYFTIDVDILYFDTHQIIFPFSQIYRDMTNCERLCLGNRIFIKSYLYFYVSLYSILLSISVMFETWCHVLKHVPCFCYVGVSVNGYKYWGVRAKKI